MRSNIKRRRGAASESISKIMKFLCSGEQLRRVDEMFSLSGPLEKRSYSASEKGLATSEGGKKLDTGNIEEAESSLRESGCLNYEEARALLGRYEYQKGNIESALHVFEGIDIAAVTPKIKIAIARRMERMRRSSQNFSTPPMSIHAVSLLLEAIFLKAKSLQSLGRHKEAAQCCEVILDTVESSLPNGLPEHFGTDCKLQETLNNAVELLPELWKLSDSPCKTILSYRRALLYHWNLDAETTARIQKEFSIFLLYSDGEASPPNLRSQMESSFVPKNNIEEAILLLMILLRKVTLKRIDWDPSILDHLSFALSISGDTIALANLVEELLPGILDRKEMYYRLALCYFGAADNSTALNLLRKLLSRSEDPNSLPALLMASRICTESQNHAEEALRFSRRAVRNSVGGCDQLGGVAICLLGTSLSSCSKSATSDSERVVKQDEALRVLETAGKMTGMIDPRVVYELSVQNAEQRKLDTALSYAKHLLKLEGGSSVKSWLLLARILSAQKQYVEGEAVISAALDQTGKWDQGELLRTKAKLFVAQGELKSAVETYSQLLALLQVQSKSLGLGKTFVKSSRTSDRRLEMEVWHDLARLYVSLSRWDDAEICVAKSRAIDSCSASRCHATGVLCEAKGAYKEALKAFADALIIDPAHVPSLLSTASVLRQLGRHTQAAVRSFLMEALRLDPMNHSAWRSVGLDKSEGSSLEEAAECFEAAIFLEETAPVEPFRI